MLVGAAQAWAPLGIPRSRAPYGVLSLPETPNQRNCSEDFQKPSTKQRQPDPLDAPRTGLAGRSARRFRRRVLCVGLQVEG